MSFHPTACLLYLGAESATAWLGGPKGHDLLLGKKVGHRFVFCESLLSIGVSKGMATDRSGWSDQALVEQIQAGEEAPFEALLGRYQDRTYRLVLSLTKNPADAEEVLQDVFLTVYRKITSFEGRSAFSTWLYRITVNTALMKLRGRGPVQESIDEYLPQFTKDGRHARMVADFTQGPEKLLLQKEREQVLREAIEALPPDYKVVLVLRDLEGLSNEEVAEVVGASVLAVKARLHRARLALRGRLERYVTASGV